ncbi:MAG: DUF421 domain-containing protein [Bacilli bacterium]|nr:DUF421 domain-containing protein [Bacilli bacterium]
MQDILSISLRTILFYFFIALAYRIMGKREVGQLGVIDLIISILIAELVAISIENFNDNLLNTIVPIVILVIIEISLAYFSVKSKVVREIFDGKPSLIIQNGKLNYKEMVKLRYPIDDLLLQLRQNSIKSIEEIEYAFLEHNGKLSIFPYNILHLKSNYPMPLIIDGDIQKDTLKAINKTKTWLNKKIYEKDLDYKDIFYAFYKGNTLFIIKKSDTIK